MTTIPAASFSTDAECPDSGASVVSTRLAERLHTLLPQTQCTRCGYADCAGYAEALAAGHAGVNQCAPGGMEGIVRLASLLRQPVVPLDPIYGSERARVVAVIDEDWCIGCIKCLDACPTDAILGASKRMHTVIAAYCTGCELCIPVCPVDCIALLNDSGARTGWAAWSDERASQALARYRRHAARKVPAKDLSEAFDDAKERVPGSSGREADGESTPAAEAPSPGAPASSADQKRALIDAAMERARALRTR